MKTKRILKALALSAVGIMALTGCDEVVAKPNDYSSKIITVDGYDKEIYNNIMKLVYDSIHSDGIGSKVLDEVLYEYSVSVFGYFDNFTDPAPKTGVITLSAAASSEASKADIDKFVKEYKAYWTVNDDGKRVNDDDPDNIVEVNEDAPACLSEVARVRAKYDSIKDRIAETMFEKISGGSYSDRNYFSELYFLKQLRSDLADVIDPYTLPVGSTTESVLILPAYEPEDVWGNEEKGLAPLLHKDFYFADESSGPHYVQKSIIPNIYRTLLTEQYILDNTYNTLGRSYARKINIISFAKNTEYPKAADYIANALVNEINEEPDGEERDFSDSTLITLDTFKKYSNAYVGVFDQLTLEEAAILTSISLETDGEVFAAKSGAGKAYFEGTSYGDLIKKYAEINDNPAISKNESDFTNNGLYRKEVGLQIKTDDLRLKDLTTTGWYIKNGGLADLPESIRSRLFSIGVANGVEEDHISQMMVDRYQLNEQDEWTYTVSDEENAYVARIKGKNYLKTSSRISGDTSDPTYYYKDILHYDSASKTYYIIQIDEASSSSKLSKTSNNSYKVSRGDDVMQDIINEVNKIVGRSESYTSVANEYYLEKMAIEYHDQTVYDYFKTNYPDLFK